MKMRVVVNIFIFLMVIVSGIRAQSWIQKANFGGASRYSSVSFVINSKAYVGIGYDFSIYYQDIWEYDPVSDTWTQMANFGGGTRRSAVGFSIGSKGYIGTGFNGSGSYRDFWEYDPPPANTWTQKANFGGAARNQAMGFSIDTDGNGTTDKGYIGTGDLLTSGNSDLQDFWEYTPGPGVMGGSWVQKANFPLVREDATGFSIGTKGYAGTGWAPNASRSDFYEYDPIGDTWTAKANYGGGAGIIQVGFAIGNKGYMGTGSPDGKQFWEYDPVGDTWTRLCDFGGAARFTATGFCINGRGYIVTGYNAGPVTFNDMWQAQPSCGGALPMELISFSAEWQDENRNAAIIKWETANEINNDYFEIEKSTDAVNFTSILTVDGAGNSSQNISYQELDLSPYKDGTSYYRLKQFDFDGAFSYSQIEALNIPEGLEIINLYPNPIEDNGNILLLSSIQADITIDIINAIGQIVQSESTAINTGVNTIAFDADQLKNGNYFLKIKAENKYQVQRKFIVNQKSQ